MIDLGRLVQRLVAVGDRLSDLGDGTTSTEAQVAHRYDEPGTCKVTLIVSNEYGLSRARRLVEVPPREVPGPRTSQGRVGP